MTFARITVEPHQMDGEHAPISHNLRHLAEKAGLELSAEQLAFLAHVTEYAIKTRYPDMSCNSNANLRHFCAMLTV